MEHSNNNYRAILFFASEWDTTKGGISTFNIELAESCAEIGRECDPPLRIWCAVPKFNDKQKEEADSKGVTLIRAKHFISGTPIDSFLTGLEFPSQW